MVAITTQQDAVRVRDLAFCYLCGEPLDGDDTINRDHVPPTSIFEKSDRDFPLILPSHETCNSERSNHDQQIGNLFRVLRGEGYQSRKGKLGLHPAPGLSTAAAGVDGFDFPAMVRRWVRGFHAALYGDYLPDQKNFMTVPPLPHGTRDGSKVKPLPDVYFKFVEELKRNRVAKSLDQIVCRNGRCRYECVWSRSDSGPWLAIYALDLYGWIDAAPFDSVDRRSCVGAYWMLDGSRPSSSTQATNLEISFKNQDPLDPFGS